ncbi:MAG: YraN family protein [Campylobacteraceae bacterium]|mgnify:CR=1 FL=1|nr:YraN family protein [Campylobacteraceae bacterium]
MGLKEYLFGFKSEDRAVKYLKNLGFEIEKRNFRSKFGEIDIVAKKDGVLHFIEVKATSGEYESIYRITPKKMEKILKAVDFYILKHKFDGFYQVDALTINKKEFKFIENITI